MKYLWILAALFFPHVSYASSIPPGAQRVAVVQFTLDASCEEDVVIQSVTLHHRGLGDVRDIERVTLFEGNIRRSRGVSIDRKTQTATMRTRNLIIPACTTAMLTVTADFSPDAVAGAEHAFSVSRDDIQASGTWKVPIMGDDINITPSGSQGSVEIAYLKLLKRVSFGKDRVVGRLTLTAREKDQILTSLTLTNDGKAKNGDLQNIVLEAANGTALTPVVNQLNADSVEFVFDKPLLLKRNATHVLEVHADVTGGIRKTIRLIVEEPSDIDVRPATRADR